MTEQISHSSGAESTAASDTRLVALAQKGDEDAFRTLFEAHKRRVYSLCLRMTRSTVDAEDLTQETFLKVFRRIATFQGDSTFSTWLHRVAVNEVLQYLRKRHFEQVSLDEIDTSLEEPVKREYRDDDRRLLGTIDRINLKRAIADLPPGLPDRSPFARRGRI
jgi:RNA polymerase sigma-70 factor (ECF subfamily)